jgi:hypothetical protein
MDAGVAILLVVAIIWLILIVLYFVRVPPFNTIFLAPNPRNWKVESEEQQTTSVINYEPYLYDQPEQPAEQIYRYFINYYCERGPNIPNFHYEDKYCDPDPLTLWIRYGDDPVETSDQDNSGEVSIPTVLFGARPIMISKSTLSYQRNNISTRGRKIQR